jgi:broad specificity phosphatase PhoE
MDKITHVVTSPMHRTLETTFLSFVPVFCRGVNAIAWPDLREHGEGPTSTGSLLNELKEKMEGLPINWALTQAGWESPAKNHENGRRARESSVRKALYELSTAALRGGKWQGIEFEAYHGTGDVEILVVSHGAFLSRLLGHTSKPP